MSANERLGIQLYFDTQNLDGQLKYIKDRLQATFGDLSKLVKAAGIGDAIKHEFQGSKNFFAEYSKQLGRSFSGSKEEIASLRKEIRDLNNEIKARSKATKLLQLDGDITELEKFKKKVDEAKAKLDELRAKQEIKLNTPQDSHVYAYKAYQDRLSSITGSSMGGSWSKDIEVQAKQAEQYLSSLSKQGLKIDNGLVVPLRDVSKQLNSASKSADGFNSSLINLFNLEARFYGVRAIIFGLSNQVRDAVSTLLDFNQALHDTAAIAQASNTELAAMSRAAIEIAQASKFNVTQVTEAMKIAAQSGVSAQDVPDVTRTAITLATGTGSTPDQAIKVLTTAMNVWKVEAQDSIKVANTFTAALNESKLEVGDLSTSFNYLANQASISNKSLEETNGIIATFAQMGVKASTIGTGVSGLLSNLMSPTPKLRKLLVELGLSLDEVNPRFNSFADIVDKFKASGVSTEQILGTFQQRIGRTMVTALNAGGDAFRQMTLAVTDTNAAFVANQEAMKGARAQLNVLKQDFVEAVKIFGENFGASLGNAVKYISNFISGLQTVEGQTLVAAIAIGTMAVAVNSLATSFKALAIAHPVLTAIGLGIGALITLLPILGAGIKKSSDELKKFNSEFAETSRKNLKLRSELIDLQFKMKQAESIQDKGQREQLYESVRVKLKKLKDEYPEYLKQIKEETRNQEDLAKAIHAVNVERHKKDAQAIREYNSKASQLEANEKRINQLSDNLNNSYTGLIPSLPGTRLAKDRREVDTLKIANESLKNELATLRSGISSARQVSGSRRLEQYSMSDMEKGLFGDLNFGPSNVKDLDEAANEKEVKAKEKRDKRIGEAIAEHKITMEKLRLENSKLESEEAKLELKDSRDLLEYKKKATAEMYEAYQTELKEIILEENKRAAQDVQGKLKFNDKTGVLEQVIGGDGFNQKEVQDAVNRAQERINQRVNNLNVKTGNVDEKISQTKIPDAVVKTTSDYYEKQADRRLRTETQTLNLQKERAKTAEELKDIDIKIVQAEINSTLAKKASYQTDLAKFQINEDLLRIKQEHGDELSADEQKYINIKNKLEDMVLLHDQLLEKQKQLSDKSFSGNFKRGMERYQKGLGTQQDAIEGLGYDMSNTLGTGVENTMNTMIDALERGGNAWRSFREGIGNVLQDIAQEIQKFLVKEAVKSFMKWAIMFFGNMLAGGASGLTDTSNSATTGAGEGGYNFATANKGGFIGFNGNVLRYDSGGQVPLNIGTPNQDSVAAWLTPGEIVIQKPAVDYYGPEYFLKHNAMKFADGGLVPGGKSSNKKSEGLEGAVLQIINLVDPNTIPQTTDTQIINVINLDIARRGPTYKTIKLAQQGN